MNDEQAGRTSEERPEEELPDGPASADPCRRPIARHDQRPVQLMTFGPCGTRLAAGRCSATRRGWTQETGKRGLKEQRNRKGGKDLFGSFVVSGISPRLPATRSPWPTGRPSAARPRPPADAAAARSSVARHPGSARRRRWSPVGCSPRRRGCRSRAGGSVHGPGGGQVEERGLADHRFPRAHLRRLVCQPSDSEAAGLADELAVGNGEHDQRTFKGSTHARRAGWHAS